MNSKEQVKGYNCTWSRGTSLRLPFDVNVNRQYTFLLLKA